MPLYGDCITLRGDEHPICQDCSGIIRTDKYVIAVISDGHGSLPHIRSEVGSRIAVDVTLRALENCLNDDKFLEKFIQYEDNQRRLEITTLFTNTILVEWGKGCLNHFEKNELTIKEEQSLQNCNYDYHFSKNGIVNVAEGYKILQLYGATLIAVVMSEKISFGFQVGDGNIVAINQEGNLDYDCLAMDSDCQDNVTTSLCQPTNNLRKFINIHDQGTQAYAMFSDGLEKSYNRADLSKVVGGLICTAPSEKLWYGSTVKLLEECTHSKTKSGDDTSFAFIVNDKLDLNRLYERTFRLRSPGLKIPSLAIPRKKICYNGMLYNDTIRENVLWSTESKDTYEGVLSNGNPTTNVKIGSSRFECELSNFELNGNGTEFRNENKVYSGTFLNGKKTGLGREYYSNGQIKYEGQFLNGKYNGSGKLFSLTTSNYYL